MKKLEYIGITDGYKEYYYNKFMSLPYRVNNSFNDFLMDVNDGVVDVEFNKPFNERKDIEEIIEYAKSIENEKV